MRKYLFDEKAYIERLMAQGILEDESILKTIYLLSRYNYFVGELSSQDSYNQINRYLSDYCSYYNELDYYKRIDQAITRAPKYPLKNVSKVYITESELNKIRALNDSRKERLAFVMLADAKYGNAVVGEDFNTSFLKKNDIYLAARVTMPRKDRLKFFQFMYNEKFLTTSLSALSNFNKVLFVDNDSPTTLELDEIDYKELAFTYMNWRDGGYKPCDSCGRLIKVRKNTKYCPTCKKIIEHKDIIKTIICEECGEPFQVTNYHNRKKVCDICREVKRRKYKFEYNKSYYENKIKTR